MTKRRILLALSVCAISCFLAWMAGWNFDTRGLLETYWALMTIVVAVFVAVVPWGELL